MIDSAPSRVVINIDGAFDMHRNLGTRLHIHGGEGLAVELVDPLRHILNTTGQNPPQRLIGGDADCAQRVAGAGIGHAVVALDQRCRASSGGSDQRLRAQILLGVAAACTGHTGDAVGIANPAQALTGVAVLLIIAFALGTLGRYCAHRAVAEYKGQRADLAAHA